MCDSQYSANFLEKHQFLVRWLEHGISRFREVAEIPQNLISDATVKRSCQAMHDDILIKIAEDLGVADSSSLCKAARTVTDLNVVLVTIEAHNAMRQWVVENQPILALRALGSVVPKLTMYMAKGDIQDPYRIARVVFVLALAPFSSQSGDILSKFAAVLNCHEPHRMIQRFSEAAIMGDDEVIGKMDQIILSNDRWDACIQWLMGQTHSLAPQCWGRLTVSKKSTDPTQWNQIWDWLLTQKEESNGN